MSSSWLKGCNMCRGICIRLGHQVHYFWIIRRCCVKGTRERDHWGRPVQGSAQLTCFCRYLGSRNPTGERRRCFGEFCQGFRSGVTNPVWHTAHSVCAGVRRTFGRSRLDCFQTRMPCDMSQHEHWLNQSAPYMFSSRTTRYVVFAHRLPVVL